LGGTVAITAVSTADTTQSAVTYVTIAQAPLAIALSQAPPPSLPVGATTNLTAIVTLDPFNAGVDWNASCQGASQSNSCGTFSLTHTASGQMTTYIAPPTVPAGNLVVTITAASTTIPTTTATALVTVTPADLRDDLLNGQYVFLLQGVREGGPWAIAGSLVADGIGDIDLATETFLGDNTSYSLSGSYFIDGDGTGTITLNGAPTGLGYWNDGQQIFKVNMVSPGLLSMEEFDGYYDPTLHVAYGGTLTGTLKQQTVTASLTPSSGSYAFLLSGFGPQNTPAYYAGTLNGTSQNFTMDRSIAGVSDPMPLTGTVTFPSPNIIFTDNTGQYSYVFRSYAVDSGHWILIATANQSQSGSGDLPAGHLYLQPSPAATVAALCPNTASYYAFTEAGATPMISATTQSSAQGSLPLAMGGVFSCVAPGNVAGFLDANINGNVSSNVPVSGAMTMSPTSNGSGASGTLTLTSGGTPPVTHTFDVYPTVTHGILMLQTDQLTQSQTPGVYLPGGVGVAYPQTPAGASATSFISSGPYIAAYQSVGAINPASGETANGEVGAWSDFLGVLTVNGQSTLEGSVNLDQFDESSKGLWTQMPDATLTGSFSAGAHGRFTGSFSICSTTTPATPCQPSSSGSTSPLVTSNQVFYIVDGSTVLSLGLDPAPPAGTIGIGPSTGILQAQPQQF
jgi:hypothetical protein